MKCYVFLPIRVLWQLQQIAGPYMYLFVWLSIYVLNFGNQNSWTGETKQKRSFQSLNFIATEPEKNVWSLPTFKTRFLIFDVRDCWEVPDTFKQYSASYFRFLLLEIQSFFFFFFFSLFFPRSERNVIEAAAKGASTAVALVGNIAANLIAFLAFLAFFNAILSWIGSMVGHPELSFEVRI